ncbi:MOSC domain-containing protein [Paracoccus pacificus]|uniref:MOSC domain-containing protein n=1 Tax=Paracoccus pacificus TaxID=1463598 RepID=A0ABW4R8T3_9RHOB
MTGRLPDATLAHIRRHAIKSAGGESLGRVELSVGRALPGDRIFGVLHAASDQRADADARLDRWLPKAAFLRGVAGPSLQAVTGGVDAEGWLDLSHPDLGAARFDPDAADTPTALAAWLSPLWPAGKPAPTRLVRAVEGAQLTDSKAAYVSVLSLGSLAALEQAAGRPLGIHRWRANFWVDGWPARAEETMTGAVLEIGPARLRVVEPIGRCDATSVDTDTGHVDGNMPGFLQQCFGHQNFGVYAEVIRPGVVSVGDQVVGV